MRNRRCTDMRAIHQRGLMSPSEAMTLRTNLMENLMLKIRNAVLILAALAANGAYAMGPSGSSADYGVAVAENTAARTIVVTPQTRWVNVTNGETVKFAVGDKS